MRVSEYTDPYSVVKIKSLHTRSTPQGGGIWPPPRRALQPRGTLANPHHGIVSMGITPNKRPWRPAKRPITCASLSCAPAGGAHKIVNMMNKRNSPPFIPTMGGGDFKILTYHFGGPIKTHMPYLLSILKFGWQMRSSRNGVNL